MAISTLAIALAAAASSSPTNFGIRYAPGAGAPPASATPSSGRAFDLDSATAIGRQWGVVTSTLRSPEHNRRVGGVPNSHHLRGRAIDIARRPGIRHRQIESAYRSQGYYLIESLDEGDHSHFAFGAPRQATQTRSAGSGSSTRWKIIYAPR